MNEAEKRIVQLIQEESFTEESVKGLKTLNVLRDEESILRIKTKLTEKTDLRNFRYPMLLPGKHRQHLRSRFRREYLGILLQPRKKSTYYEVKPGEIVLIEDDSKKRLLWPMAKVLEVYPGKDNTVRVVRVKTQSGEIVRPVRRIYPLEINCTDDESHSSGKLLTTRSGRTVKVPSRF
ncbi:DUF5641 domain-containing protein [Nephila pilipes]|uniref:DUF5641 domain-containing protein n=1 Tax=Nephila pilipes TaxID=299642 RepID=A0A8X6PGM9_NEPPI|nr:DUF5641 domain-containing protein [Nephila pilipes]